MEKAASAPAKWWRRLALLFLTLCLIVVLDVAAARVYRRVTGHTWPAADPERLYRIPSAEYHHDLLPNYSTDDARWGGAYKVRTNSLGFRDAEVREVPLVPQGRRILVIGDSFTEGLGVPYEETFAGRLGQALAPTEVLDAAVMSYAPCIYYRKVKNLIEERGLRFDELVVGVDVGDAADEAETYELKDDEVRARGFKDRAKEFVKANSILLFTILDYALREPIGTIQPRPAIALDASDAEIEAALRRRAAAYRSRWPYDEKLWKKHGEAGTRLMIEHMDKLLALVKAKGIPLTVVVYPWPDQVVEGDPDCRYVRIWRDWCRERGVRFVDALPKFEMGAPWSRRAEVIGSCFIPGDVHFSAEGHRRVAEAILDAMK